MARYAVINESTGMVFNVIELDLGSNYELVNGYRYIQSNAASPGDHFDGERFNAPELPETPEILETPAAESGEIQTRIQSLENQVTNLQTSMALLAGDVDLLHEDVSGMKQA